MWVEGVEGNDSLKACVLARDRQVCPRLDELVYFV